MKRRPPAHDEPPPQTRPGPRRPGVRGVARHTDRTTRPVRTAAARAAKGAATDGKRGATVGAGAGGKKRAPASGAAASTPKGGAIKGGTGGTTKGGKGAKAAAPRTRAPQLALQAEVASEVEAYGYIRDQLKALGWVVKNPDRSPDGQVWTQNQCLGNPAIQRALGARRPENIVKVGDGDLWVIEAKSTRKALPRALGEAEHVYARPIHDRKEWRVPLLSGVAGNDATDYEVRTRLLVGDTYEPVTINGVEATGLLTPAQVAHLLATGEPDIADFIIDEGQFLRAAEDINETLHNGGINKNDRARVMAALLLALLDDEGLKTQSSLDVLIQDINARTESLLRKNGKVEFHPFVRIVPPTNFENHVKYKAALVATLQELTNLSIRSAMNSGADVLGKFYEVFLRYGNGAKEIGIVLTPRHVTRFAVDSVGVGPTDVVYDPACGTGGFLVAAFDHVRQNASAKQLELFKQHNLFGVERESAVAALAIVNMIFRGDGKNNIVEANCFSKFLHKTVTRKGHPTASYDTAQAEAGEEAVTRVFMNPPFALKASDEWESRFVDAALRSMADGGILLAVIPTGVLTEGPHAAWRRDTLLGHHTLLAAVSLHDELFYPVKIQTVVLVVRKGKPHPKGAPVFWGRVENDGFVLSKGKRLPKPESGTTDLHAIEPALRGFLANPAVPVAPVPRLLCVAPLDPLDPLTELVPELYLHDEPPALPTVMGALDLRVRESVTALVNIDLWHGRPGRPSIVDAAQTAGAAPGAAPPPGALPAFERRRMGDLFDLTRGNYHNLSKLPEGHVPVASCTEQANAIAGFYDVPATTVYRDALSVAANGTPLTARMHPYEFAAKDDVLVALPKDDLTPEAVVYLQAAIEAERWRFSYYRKCYTEKMRRTAITVPVRPDGMLDTDFMAAVVRAQPYWWFLAPRLADWTPTRPAEPPPPELGGDSDAEGDGEDAASGDAAEPGDAEDAAPVSQADLFVITPSGD